MPKKTAAPAARPEAAAPSERLLLLDGHSLAYRAFFALPTSLVTSTGQITNAVYGFTSMLIKLLTEQRTDRIGVAFDLGAPTIRLAQYPEYKAGRAATPTEFSSQMGLLREVLDTLRVPVFQVPDHEADDVIATLARRGVERGLAVAVVTADRDMLQLVGDEITVLFNRKGITDITRYDRDAVVERFGIPPEQLPDLVALKGDPSDNLPGVPGIGDKTASALVQQFGSIEAMYERLDELPQKLRKLGPRLEEAKEQVLRNKRLAQLVDDLELGVDPADIRMGEWDQEVLRKLFLSLEFRSLLERLPDVRRPSAPAAAAEFVARTGGGKDVKELEAAARGGARLAVATRAGSNGIALATGDEEAVWMDDPSAAGALLADPDVAKVAHDAKELFVARLRAGSSFAGLVFDSKIAAYLLDPAAGTYEVEDLSLRYLDRELPTAKAADDGAQLSLDVAPEETAAPEAVCAQAAALLPLADTLAAQLDRLGMTQLYREVEQPLIEVLARLELTGVAIDVDLLQQQGNVMGSEIGSLEESITRHAGGPININSPPQLREVLYDRLGLTPGRKTKTGYSTDAAALENLRGLHPIVDDILRYRELTKLKSTYLDALPRLVDATTGRLHAKFHQTVTTTGRLSTSDPNLQNIPVRTGLGREIRRAFVAGFPEHTLIVADYSQIELRVLAHITRDPGLRDAFAKDLDIHAATAAKIYGFTVEELPRDLRDRAKAINFGLAYGMNAFGLGQRLGIMPDEAQEFIDAYFTSFPGVKEFMASVVREAYRDGYTMTLLGRRRYIEELTHRNPRVRQMGERQALNAPIQGTAADIIKLAMIKVDAGLRGAGLGARMVLTVHDELIFEVPNLELDATREAVRSLMEQAYPMEVPLKVDLAIGANWAEAKGG
ncbi:MAG: DNA polymerase I [Actinomycetota bacterium]